MAFCWVGQIPPPLRWDGAEPGKGDSRLCHEVAAVADWAGLRESEPEERVRLP
jgi:hypothetical protein